MQYNEPEGDYFVFTIFITFLINNISYNYNYIGIIGAGNTSITLFIFNIILKYFFEESFNNSYYYSFSLSLYNFPAQY